MSETSIWSGEILSLGEGPLTHHLRGSLIWVDINQARLYERAWDENITRVTMLEVLPSAAGIVDDSTVLLATEADMRTLNLDTGVQETLIAFPHDDEMRANDGRVHPSGAFWIGTMAKDGRGRPGAIYRLFEGELSCMIEDVVTPNSICFAADGTFAYYTDTPTMSIMKVPTDPKTGEISGKARVFVKVEGVPGGPDGSVTDSEGNLWNARWGGSSIDVYSPAGERIHAYKVPVRQPTCPSFVGPDLDRIVTTSASVGLSDPDPLHDGATIELHVPAKGRPEPIVKL